MVVVRIHCVTFVSPYQSARGDMHKYRPTEVAQACKSQQCWGVGADVSFVAAGRWGDLRKLGGGLGCTE